MNNDIVADKNIEDLKNLSLDKTDGEDSNAEPLNEIEIRIREMEIARYGHPLKHIDLKQIMPEMKEKLDLIIVRIEDIKKLITNGQAKKAEADATLTVMKNNSGILSNQENKEAQNDLAQ